MNILKNILFVLRAFLLIYVCLYVAMYIPVHSTSFYKSEFKKTSVYEYIKMPEEELLKVTSHMIDYFNDKNDDLQIKANFFEGEQNYFNDREIKHMVDVKSLLISSRNYFYFSFVLSLLITLFVIFSKNIKFNAKKMFFWDRITIISFTSIFIFLVILISINFNRAFTIFHEMFFTNDLWILDPNTDHLLQMVPLQFFIDISIFISILFIIFLVLWLCLENLFIKRSEKGHGNI